MVVQFEHLTPECQIQLRLSDMHYPTLGQFCWVYSLARKFTILNGKKMNLKRN